MESTGEEEESEETEESCSITITTTASISMHNLHHWHTIISTILYINQWPTSLQEKKLFPKDQIRPTHFTFEQHDGRKSRIL